MEELANKDLPAMPVDWYDFDSAGIRTVREQSFGLTKREYIAALAMQGLVSSTIEYGESSVTQAQKAVEMADELLTALDA